MSDQQDLDQRSATGLRDMARMLLDGIEKVDDREQKRKLARQAFAVLQEAIALQPADELWELSLGMGSPSSGTPHLLTAETAALGQ